MIIAEMILKVTSKCNLNCKYCYVFNLRDKSYKIESEFIEEDTVIHLLYAIEEYCRKYKIHKFAIVFHGGEPLLAGKEFYTKFIQSAEKIVKSTTLTYILQTNGTLLDEEWVNTLNQLNIITGISLDGPAEATSYRVFRSSGAPAFNRIMEGLTHYKNGKNRLAILSVINVDMEPKELYEFYRASEIKALDLLLPDANHEKPGKAVGKVGDWLIKMFDLWYFDKVIPEMHITLFVRLTRRLIGDVNQGYEPMGRNLNGVITVKSNGDIEVVDSLRICGDGFPKTHLNVKTNKIEEIFDNELMKKYYTAHQDETLCKECLSCVVKDICGGSVLAHRFSKENSFDNPSVYCKDIQKLILHVQNVLLDDIPALKELGMEALKPTDFK